MSIISKPHPKFELARLPSTYAANDVEVAFLRRCLGYSELLNKPFRIQSLVEIAQSIGISKKDQISLFQGLSRHGFIYSLSEHASIDYVSEELDYFLHAEKIVQAIINRFPDVVIGKKLCKFETDGNILDGGFVMNESEIFNTLMLKIDAYYGNREDRTAYLPSFIRIYECIGTADGRDYFTNRDVLNSSLTAEAETAEPKFTIPKYVVLQRHDNNTWIADNRKVCVCIS